MNRITAPLLISALLLAGCGGRFSDSGWNPFGWFGDNQGPTTLEPEEGYVATADERSLIPHLASAHWQPLNEGRLLVVSGLAPTKGYHSAALVTARRQPKGRISADADGVLRLRFVALPPPQESEAARMPANPTTDTITAAMAFSHTQLARFTRVEIAGGTNSITLNR